MKPFDDHDTISVPINQLPLNSNSRQEAVVALRIHPTGAELELPPDRHRISVGGSQHCDLVLSDPYASSLHCTFERRPDGALLVRDRKSKNGTFVNGNRILAAEVRTGTRLSIGRTILTAVSRRSRGVLSAYERLRGEDPAFRRAVDTAVRAAATECNVLIVGETGTGKELIAQTIHESSARSSYRFVPVNCGAIPRELVESELFGHRKGAFTGAVSDRDGVFVQADGGTLFLDELGELPRLQQPHLLRVLETREVRRIGGSEARRVDVRLVSATNQLDLGRPGSSLRLDLYHRVATVVIELPPLRARRGDIPKLVAAFLAELAPRFGVRRVAPSVMRALTEYGWPGNIRELRHAIHRAVAFSRDELALERLLPANRPRSIPMASKLLAMQEDEQERQRGPLNSYDQAVHDVIRDAYEKYGSVRRAAEALGIPKSTFADRARRFGVNLKRKTG